MKLRIVIMMLLCAAFMQAQDLSSGLQVVNDLGNYPMQPQAKPAYLDSYVDPSFGTTIRRISNVGQGGLIKPMYSTIQAWNADESYMILYESGRGHQLLNGFTYQFIRYLDDIRPDDIEEIFWDFEDPDVFYYLDKNNNDFIRYHVSTSSKELIVNLGTLANCANVIMGDDIQMMSWNSDIIGFRCNNNAYSYRISTGTLREFNLNTNVGDTAPMPGPSGNRFYHLTNIYGNNDNFQRKLDESVAREHSCIGKLANGDDGVFAVAFATGPGGCEGNIIQHNMRTGLCTPLISVGQGYPYSQSSTHISALAHKNTQGGWVAASMIGYAKNGQSLLDQELVLARADENGDVTVCRIGHHRGDQSEFGYLAEPQASISPTGTRVIFASDWSGSQDGQSVDTYVVELPTFGGTPPPPPPTGTNSLTWDTQPTSISTGNNSFTMDYSLTEPGVVFIQVFDENWNPIAQDYRDVEIGADRITLNLDVPNGKASAKNNHFQAMLFNSNWSKELADRLELTLDSGDTPPPPPPSGNSLTWDTKPTSVSAGTNNFTLDYSINQSGVVFIQVFDKDWNRFDYYIKDVSAGSGQVTLPLSVSSPSTNNNHLQAFLLSSDWNDEFERLELALPSGNTPPPPPPSSGNSLKWTSTPTSISNGNNSFTMDYSIEENGVVFIQVFDENWNQIDQDYRDVSTGTDRITLDLDVPNGKASASNNYLQAMLLNSSWVEMTDVPRLEETIGLSGAKLEDAAAMNFAIFPNPFTHAFNVEYYLPEEQPLSIQLFTQEGKLIRTINNEVNRAAGNHTETVVIDNLPSGMYLLHLTTSDSHGVQKLVKF